MTEIVLASDFLRAYHAEYFEHVSRGSAALQCGKAPPYQEDAQVDFCGYAAVATHELHFPKLTRVLLNIGGQRSFTRLSHRQGEVHRLLRSE